MYRYSHFLYRPRPGCWPGRVFFVEVQSEAQWRPQKDRVTRYALKRWYARSLILERGEYVGGPTAEGYTTEEFWAAIQRGVKDVRNVLIFSSACHEAWPLLDLWGGLERGEIQISEVDYRGATNRAGPVPAVRPENADESEMQSYGAMQRLRERREGYIVTSDEVHIACFRFPGQAPRMRWLDTRNFSGDFAAESSDLEAISQSTLEWFREVKCVFSRHGLGALKNTAASQAFHAFRSKYMDTPIHAHQHPKALALEDASYFGGRCEVFRLGVAPEKVYHLDFRSLYPWVCTAYDLPVHLEEYVDEVECRKRPYPRYLHNCIARVTLRAERPLFPLRWRDEMAFPIGRFTTTLAGPELVSADLEGVIERVHEYCVYRMDRSLERYARRLYDFRCDAEQGWSPQMSALAKKMLVALPGKFGEKSWRWIACPNEIPDTQWGYWWGADPNGVPCRYRAQGGLVCREVNTGFAPDAVPSIASWITSAGRVELSLAIGIAGRENVYYCDTDSVFVSQTGYDRLVAAGKVQSGCLGKLQLKGEVDRLEVRGVKHYVADGKVVCAGLPPEATLNDDDSTEYTRWRSEKEAIRSGRKPDCVQIPCRYRRAMGYVHGIVGENGIVNPLVLGEE